VYLWKGLLAIESAKAQPGKVVFDSGRPRKRAKYEIVDAEATSALLVITIGLAFALVGLIDLALLWTPLGFGSPAWEFATLSQTFSNWPVTGLGLLLAVYGLVRHPNTGAVWAAVAVIVFALVAVALAAMAVLYLTVVPTVLRNAPVEGVQVMGRAVYKVAAEAVIYPIVFGAIAIILWRGLKRTDAS
jgi:hypothetical protein